MGRSGRAAGGGDAQLAGGRFSLLGDAAVAATTAIFGAHDDNDDGGIKAPRDVESGVDGDAGEQLLEEEEKKKATTFSTVCDDGQGFDDELPDKPQATTFLTSMPGLGLRAGRTGREGKCARELVHLPVVTSNDAYRLGNAVERQGIGWIGARRLVLEGGERDYKDSILFNFLMGSNEEQRAFVGCVVAHKRRLERDGVRPSELHGDNETIVVPLRLSDKVRFMVEDYPVINAAVAEYKRRHCPWCTRLVIMTLLVWGEDKNHVFAYTYAEYVQSLTVLHAVAKRAQSPEGGALRVSIRSTLNADNDFVYSAFSPHLVLPMVTPSSWHQLLTYCNRAVFDAKRRAAAIDFFDRAVAPKLQLPGRRQRLANEYARLEAVVPETKVTVVNWFQREVRRRKLDEHKVTVSQMLTWHDWPAIIKPYIVGMKAYDNNVLKMAEAAEAMQAAREQSGGGQPTREPVR